MGITLVDTPGFNDTYRTDTDVLLDIANWMEVTYKENFKLSGVIYLHPITRQKMEGSDMRNLRMFRKLCGQQALKNVVLVTTHWDNVNEEIGNRRERELREKDGFWKSILDYGAKLARFTGECDSGLQLVGMLAQKPKITLTIQHELVNEGKALIETDAGTAVNEDLIKLQRRYEADLRAAKAELEEAIRGKDEEYRQLILEERRRLERKMGRIEAEREKLNIERRHEIRAQENEWHLRLRRMEERQNLERQRWDGELQEMRAQQQQGSPPAEAASMDWVQLAQVAMEFVKFLNSVF